MVPVELQTPMIALFKRSKGDISPNIRGTYSFSIPSSPREKVGASLEVVIRQIGWFSQRRSGVAKGVHFCSATTDRQSVEPTFSMACVTAFENCAWLALTVRVSEVPSGKVTFTSPGPRANQTKGQR